MPYPEQLVSPMRAELTRLGVQELTSAAEVTTFFGEASEGTAVVVVNSVCGCAAANARPAVAMVSQLPDQPDLWGTVFAGQDLEATAQARVHMMGIPPSSPSIALFRNGDPVFVLERRHIEGRTAAAIATDLAEAIQRHCVPDAAVSDSVESPTVEKQAPDGLPSTFRSIL